MPAVSVIVPNYNHARFLPKRIETVLRQTIQDFELILLDDCSTDDSRSILSKYAADPRVRIELNDVNSGSPFKQWNKGVRLARAKYVWLAESDDYADDHFLEYLLPVLENDPQITFVYCRSWCLTGDGRVNGFGDSYLHDLNSTLWTADFCIDGSEACRNYFVLANPVPNASAVLFRKSIYENVGGADESYRLCGDWKLWAAMALTGKIAHVRAPLSYFRFHDASVRTRSMRRALDVCEYLRVIQWILGQVTPAREARDKLGGKIASMWVPSIMSLHVPLRQKRIIVREACAIDPHPMRRIVRPALRTIRLKFARHWRGLRSIFSPTM